MKKLYDLAVKTGTHEKDGETKNRYENVGSIMEKDDGGRFILLNRTFNPAGVPNPQDKSSIIVSMFDVKQKEQSDTDKVKDAFENDPFA